MIVLLSILGGLLGVVIAIAITVGIVYSKIKSTVGDANMQPLKEIVKSVKDAERAEYCREKSVKGMTNVLEDAILYDFPDFNKDFLFSTCQSNLTKIFNCLESRNSASVRSDENFTYLKDYLSEQVEDMKSSDVYEKYDDIQFHRHAISSYQQKQGKATIKVSTTLGYYYSTNRKDKKAFPDLRKETRYTSEFVYICDESKLDDGEIAFVVHCPNCGAPLKHLKDNRCEYCSSYVEKIDFKIWKMTSYKEDY